MLRDSLWHRQPRTDPAAGEARTNPPSTGGYYTETMSWRNRKRDRPQSNENLSEGDGS